MTATAEFRLLGPLVVRSGGVLVPVPPGQQRVLLAALLLAGGRPVSVDQLAGMLWETGRPSSERLSVQNAVMRLRRSLGGAGPAIATVPGGYLIRVGPGELDVTRFEAALAGGRAAARDGAWARAAEILSGGLRLWRGEPLSGVRSDALTAREVPRLLELRLQALEARIDADLHLGRHAELIVELGQLVAAEPLRERLHGLLMTALYRDGQGAAALAAYRSARQTMIAELGTEPGPQLWQLHQRILTGDLAPDGEPGAGRPAAGAALRYSLPPDTAAFTGREAELARIMAETAGEGGVVAIRAIDGMPGVGKSALAIHVAHLLKDKFPDRQLFVGLRGHTPGQQPASPSDALAGLLAAAGVSPRALPADLDARTALWRDRMAGQSALLILDNAASSAQVIPLLPGTPACLVLVTSRRHLADLPGGAVSIPLGVLTPGQAQDMFRRLAPGAADGPAAAVAELAGLAGYLPLAISLLARVYRRHPAWTLADLISETRGSLLTLAAEHDSVAAALAVSYRHLAPGQQGFFRDLGLFPGSTIDRYAAAALAGASLAQATDELDSLHAEGLLTETGYRRYGMHDLIRRYAADLAAAGPPGRRDQALGRLLDYYQHTSARAETILGRHPRPASGLLAPPPAEAPDLPDDNRALAWARAERATLMACLDRATAAGDHARVVALTASAATILSQDGPWSEATARHGTAAAAARQAGDREAEAAALNQLGIVQRLSGDLPGAADSLEAALAIFRAIGSGPGLAAVLHDLGVRRAVTGDFPAAAGHLDESLAICRELGDRRGQAYALYDRGGVRLATGDSASAARDLNEALAIFRDLPDRLGLAHALWYMGETRRLTGDYPAAELALREGLDIYRDLGNQLGLANIGNDLGVVRLAIGDYQGAEEALQTALAGYRDLGNQLGQASTLTGLGAVRRAAGQLSAALSVLTEGLRLARQVDSPTMQANALYGRGAVRRRSGDWPGADRDLRAALAIFTAVGDDVGQAETLNETAALHADRGEPGPARDAYHQALAIAQRAASPHEEATARAGLGHCALAQGDAAGGAAALRAARELFEQIGAPEAVALARELDGLAPAGTA
jgi:DNA-binding SARP family transcriptional activator/tetratricopeptide (TPR) repeat protein